MSRVHKDSRDVEIKAGDKVAYNRSGSVISGEVVSVGAEIRIMAAEAFWPRRYDWSHRLPDGTFRYSVEVPAVSRVRNGTSVLVL